MKIFKHLIFFSLIQVLAFGQSTDSTQSTYSFSGSLGITNNGFAIIPTFSLNSPAAIINLALKKDKFSLEPDIRLVPDLSKGGILFWFRHQTVSKPKFSLRTGVHPAFSFVKRNIKDENAKDLEITEMLRFAAFEVVPNYAISPKLNIGAMYLHGQGLQNHGPQKTDVLFLNAALSNLKISKNVGLTMVPMVYFLNTDGFRGDYFSATAILSHAKMPFYIQPTINQTFKSNVPGNQDFMWNVLLGYRFGKTFKSVK